MRTLVGAARRVDARSSRAARSTTHPLRAGRARAAGGWPPSSATTCPVAWQHRSERYGEKLATPDTSVGDLVGDVDPVKVARGPHARRPRDRALRPACRAPTAASSASTSCPTSPSASRSRCSTCSRSATSRSAATRCGCRSTSCSWPRANPEDYTNRGRIITPLKDRFGAEIRTHYPHRGAATRSPSSRQEAVARRRRARAPPRGRRAVHPRAARVARGRPALRRVAPVRDRRGRGRRRVRAAPGRPRRRGACRRAGLRRARPSCPTLLRQGRVRDGRGGPRARGRSTHLLRVAVAETFRVAAVAASTCPAFTELFAEGADRRDR